MSLEASSLESAQGQRLPLLRPNNMPRHYQMEERICGLDGWEMSKATPAFTIPLILSEACGKLRQAGLGYYKFSEPWIAQFSAKCASDRGLQKTDI